MDASNLTQTAPHHPGPVRDAGAEHAPVHR